MPTFAKATVNGLLEKAGGECGIGRFPVYLVSMTSTIRITKRAASCIVEDAADELIAARLQGGRSLLIGLERAKKCAQWHIGNILGEDSLLSADDPRLRILAKRIVRAVRRELTALHIIREIRLASSQSPKAVPTVTANTPQGNVYSLSRR